MKALFLLSVFLLSVPAAFAGTTVIYFGGFRASQKQVDCWADNARKNPDYSGYTFKAYPYPAGAGAGKDSAVAAGSATIDAILANIKAKMAKDPTEKFVIAGHSSGAALSNRLAEKVPNPERVSLYSLDGFAASESLQKRVNTTCVYAYNPETGLQSRNAGSMKSRCPKAKQKGYSTTGCSTPWCMHFSIVNKTAPSNLGGGADFIQRGYKGCGANLFWLPPKRAVAAAAPAPARAPVPSSPRSVSEGGGQAAQ